MIESSGFQSCHPAEYRSRLNLSRALGFNFLSLLISVGVFIYFRNHSWVSFSGFSTAYNEVFELLSKGGGGITDNVHVTNSKNVTK